MCGEADVLDLPTDAEPVRVVEGDALEVLRTLPAGCIDAVVTDPPYGIDYGRAGGFSASHGWGAWRESVDWDMERPPTSPSPAVASPKRWAWARVRFWPRRGRAR